MRRGAYVALDAKRTLAFRRSTVAVFRPGPRSPSPALTPDGVSEVPDLPRRAELAADGLAFLAAGSWCGLNFWRCRQAHCMVSAAGWLGLSLVAFAGAGLGHSLIHGDEQLVFLGVLVAALAFEGIGFLAKGTNIVIRTKR